MTLIDLMIFDYMAIICNAQFIYLITFDYIIWNKPSDDQLIFQWSTIHNRFTDLNIKLCYSYDVNWLDNIWLDHGKSMNFKRRGLSGTLTIRRMAPMSSWSYSTLKFCKICWRSMTVTSETTIEWMVSIIPWWSVATFPVQPVAFRCTSSCRNQRAGSHMDGGNSPADDLWSSVPE